MDKNRYYHLWIAAAKDQVFFSSNLDKAFFISLFQDLLSPRNHLCVPPNHRQKIASQLDLVAYSLTDFGMNLLVYAPDTETVEVFGQSLLIRYATHLNQQSSWEMLPFDTIFAHDLLQDEYEALSISREIHLLHDDWRNDRYSSIGFYLDDRRGDWIQPWRITKLYSNNPHTYLNYLLESEKEYTRQGLMQLDFLET